MHRATVYRLLQRVLAQGEAASQTSGEVTQSSCVVKCELSHRDVPGNSFGLQPWCTTRRARMLWSLSNSVSQLNRVRASLGLSRRLPRAMLLTQVEGAGANTPPSYP
jgi:hypothetical protein